MDLFELQAKLKLDDSSFNKGINDAEKAGEKLKNGLSAASVAVGNIATDMIRKGVSGINNVVRGAVDGYANYQQLIGGVETLFKKSASTVANYAKESYKTTGLSANDYMETVTSFSASLLQGLKGNTEQAAEIANMAVTDMADNANKMGTDISSIQAAYQGFAKQNYTMLDNLKLGYGGTKTEMVRLVNESGVLDHKIKDLDGITFDQLIQAIHAIQEQMGVTGTTAEEANKTISGSAASMKSAWQDMLTAVTGEGTEDFTKYGYSLDEATAKFKKSFETYMSNLIPAVQTTLNNAPELINTIADAITSIPPKALSQASQSMIGVMTGAADGAKKIVDWVIDSLVTSINDIHQNPEQIQAFGTAVGELIGNTINRIVTEVPTLIPKIFETGVTLAGSLVEGLFSGLFGLDDGLYGAFSDADEAMTNSIRDATQSATQAQGILTYMDDLVKKYGDAATDTEEWANALKHLEEVLPGATEEIAKQNTPLSETVGYMQEQVKLLKEQAIEQAKQKALQEKREAYLKAEGDLAVAQFDLEEKKQVRETAVQELSKLMQSLGYAGEMANVGIDITKPMTEQQSSIFRDWAQDIAKELRDTGTTENEENATVIEGLTKTITGADTEMATLTGQIEDLGKQVTFAKTELEVHEKAIQQAAQAAIEFAEAATGAANKINGITISPIKIPIGMTQGLPEGAVAGKAPGTFYTPNAVGKDFIPFNGYRAELHRGEAILTAAENRERLSGGMDYEALGSMIGDSIERSFAKVGIYMSGNRVADLTTKRMRGNINEETNARQRAMGG